MPQLKTYASLLKTFNRCPAETRYNLPLQTEDPDQLASEETNWSGSVLLPFSMWICINNLDQVIWLVEN